MYFHLFGRLLWEHGRMFKASVFSPSSYTACRFHALGPIYYRSSNGAILVYDMWVFTIIHYSFHLEARIQSRRLFHFVPIQFRIGTYWLTSKDVFHYSFKHRTDEDSFQKVKNWVKELRKMLGSEIVLAIVGNKIDLNKDRTVPFDMAVR